MRTIFYEALSGIWAGNKIENKESSWEVSTGERNEDLN